MRPAILFGFVSALCFVTVAADPMRVAGIEISADIPVAKVAPRPRDRVTLRLPALTYSLTMTVHCDKDRQPESVSISIADSRRTFSAEQLHAGAVLESELRIPSDQIAPLRVERFCISDRQVSLQPGVEGNNKYPERAAEKITISAAVSAQASLRCASESDQTIMYVTKPLDVTLECSEPEFAAEIIQDQPD
jgi:hypothetical protein